MPKRIRAGQGGFDEIDCRGRVVMRARVVKESLRGGKEQLVVTELPYTVKLRYTVEEGGIAVKVDASPWAIVKNNGLSLGRTPRDVRPASRRGRRGWACPVRSRSRRSRC